MAEFEGEQQKLNKKQLEAVENIEGPLLVMAGPGTGKTQLLSSRVAQILTKTDTGARNILCLTFTESGAQNMRDRLRGLIGDAAYDVTISTYHSFGSDIIKSYSEYFQQIGLERSEDIRMERPVDELTQIQIVESIIAKLPFDSPLLSSRYFIKDVVSTISDLKQNLISPDKLRRIARSNLEQIESVQPLLDRVINSAGGISRKKAEKYAQYESLLRGLDDLSGDLTRQATADLGEAHDKVDEIDSPTPLREWKDRWLHKNDQDQFVLTDPGRSQKMLELAGVYGQYQKCLRDQAAYDFDDMILHAIDGLANNDELRYNLQERYQYILLDEFQDTNPSQFELVKRIADHPVHEGRPNVMAVGDDDQAIYAFQGAFVGNMKDFTEAFKDVAIISLNENYRSHPDILHVARGIAEQIENRLHKSMKGVDKVLSASSKNLPKDATIGRYEFDAEASEYAWIAGQIGRLIQEGADPSEIAVLAPKHRVLEGLVPFLHQTDVNVSYEKRENILETEIIQGLKLAAELLQALAASKGQLAGQYLPLVLSLPYWNINPVDIWKVNWQHAKRDENRSWAEIALDSPPLKTAVLFYLALSSSAATEALELTLDKLIGSSPVRIVEDSNLASPLKEFYFDPSKRAENALEYYEAVSHLSVIRARLRDHQAGTDKQLTLSDFLDLFKMHEAAESPLINSHPVAQSPRAVQLMTVYKAKGLEFDHVFIIHAHDDVWGSTSKSGNNKLPLPANLAYIRYARSSDDERRRLLFVAATRAKHGLYITSHAAKDNGKKTSPVKYLAESDGISALLPEQANKIISAESNRPDLARSTETLWQAGQISLPADFHSLMADRLQSYRMSPTHLNSIIDLEHAGPQHFLIQTLLRFPQAPGASGEYGTAVHNTLEWYQNTLNRGESPNTAGILTHYQLELERRYMSDDDRRHALDKGSASLVEYLKARQDMFKRQAKAEINFHSESVMLGDARLSGKIDRLEIDQANKTVRIADYKTGKPLAKWGNDIKSIKYKQQLYFYKFLIEQSGTWRDYKIAEARLEFVEADKNGRGDILPPLVIEFDEQEEADVKNLIGIIWLMIQSLDLPDTSEYTADLAGSKKFMKALLNTQNQRN